MTECGDGGDGEAAELEGVRARGAVELSRRPGAAGKPTGVRRNGGEKRRKRQRSRRVLAQVRSGTPRR